MSFIVFWIIIYGYCNEVILFGIYRNFLLKNCIGYIVILLYVCINMLLILCMLLIFVV